MIELIKSPCKGVCRLDDNRRCIGCERDTDEIANWATMSAGKRKTIMRSIRERREVRRAATVSKEEHHECRV